MKKLIPIINKLQDVFSSIGHRESKIDLPQIAVVGEQSTGKSSVLEAIVGHDFLPRGAGICTRRPLILQLVHRAEGAMTADLLDQLLERKKIKYKRNFTTFQAIRDAIEYCTEKASPGNKNILPDPIRLRITAPDVLNLTVVDLPGITKVPLPGQDPDIEKITKKMVHTYIRKKNCIILAICAANHDIANSEGLKMAKQVDVNGDRTLGVLTKLDIMDKGVDAMPILTGKLLPLKLGYIGIVNRSQYDIDGKKKIKEALRAEQRFFASHAKYKSVAHRLGVPFLAMTLNKMLMEHIRGVLPELREKIDTLLHHAQNRLLKYGPALDENVGMKGYMLQLLTKFSTEYVDCIEGRNVDDMTRELFGGARINYIFYKKYIPALLQLDPTKTLSDYDVKLRIQIAKGTRSSLYIPEAAFEGLVKMQVKRLEIPSLHCVDLVLSELVTIVDHCCRPLKRFPALKDRVRDYTVMMLKKYVKPLKAHIRNVVSCEMAYTNTNHPDFFGGGTKVLLLMEKIRSGGRKKGQLFGKNDRRGADDGRKMHGGKDPLGGSKKGEKKKDAYAYNDPREKKGGSNPVRGGGAVDREKMEVEVIRTLLGQYFEIVRKQIADNVPKSIMYFLVNMSAKNLHAELINGLFAQTDPNKVLKENDDIKQKRRATEKMLAILLKGQEVLNEVRDIQL